MWTNLIPQVLCDQLGYELLPPKDWVSPCFLPKKISNKRKEKEKEMQSFNPETPGKETAGRKPWKICNPPPVVVKFFLILQASFALSSANVLPMDSFLPWEERCYYNSGVHASCQTHVFFVCVLVCLTHHVLPPIIQLTWIPGFFLFWKWVNYWYNPVPAVSNCSFCLSGAYREC